MDAITQDDDDDDDDDKIKKIKKWPHLPSHLFFGK